MRNAFVVTACMGLGALGCASQGASSPAAATNQAPALVGTIKEIMQGIVDPTSDVVFESVSTTISAAGVVEKQPRTDEEWATVEHNALSMAEAMNLLTAPGRPVAHPNEMNVGPTEPDAPELTPAQIRDKISTDPALFARYARTLQDAALEARERARAKDVAGLLNVGEKIDMACENCHLYYWYPKQGTPAPAP